MKADDYFDSDLGDTDSNTSLDHDLGAGEAYLANCGDTTMTDNDLIDEELTISRQKTILTQILTATSAIPIPIYLWTTIWARGKRT